MAKLLIIEDHFEVRENLEEMLDLNGYDIKTASNGEEGIEVAEAWLPDLILCDIMMPGIDGYGVLSHLSRYPKTAGIPFIFLTAKADKRDIRRGMLMGADDYLTKPFEEQELLSVIQTRLEKNDLLRDVFDYSGHGLHEFLKRARQMKGLDTLSQDWSTQSFQTGKRIVDQGELPTHLFFVASGSITATHSRNPDLTQDYGPGDFFGHIELVQGVPYRHQAIAVEPTELSLLPRDDFFSLLLNNRYFSIRFIKMLAKEMTELQDQLFQIVQKTTDERVIHALLKLEKEANQVSLEALQASTKIANLNIAHTLEKLNEAALIEIKRDQIRLLDIPQLHGLLTG
jgi:CheY-like chemotaxis protein